MLSQLLSWLAASGREYNLRRYIAFEQLPSQSFCKSMGRIERLLMRHFLIEDVLADIKSVTGQDVELIGPLVGGFNSGAIHVGLGPDARDAVLKVEQRTTVDQPAGVLRASRIVHHMREMGYPTPAWLGVGFSEDYVWHLTEFVDAAPALVLNDDLIEQLLRIIELQSCNGSENYDHWRYSWNLATEAHPISRLDLSETAEQCELRKSVATLPRHSTAVAALVARVRSMCTGTTPPQCAPDMVHADLNPSNVLVKDGSVVAVVDIANAGRGTRATDLVTLQWHLFDHRFDIKRQQLWVRVLDIVGWQQTAVLLATQILLQIEWRVRTGRDAMLPAVLERGHRAVDELYDFR
ncbi:phosphotransferase [Rudaeicoccus suwonensis]|uniref:Phosphotransferase family enzyme n=1 Tax=Rudaeicoccus suwonensis TaxID=657409 RepID=A0A561DVN1_9MICO|nr:phosphotransferase [Rudaeicoccus suwonensis]TWE07416.1 phosphotransferase family enzyme [Rudaeicoccus suwonensis]